MAWSAVPVIVGDDCLAAQIEEVRQAIIERQNVCGGTNPTQINAGDSMLAATINNYRTAIQGLGAYFCDDTNLTVPLPLINTTGFFAYMFAKGAIETASGWTRVPTRIGPYSFGSLVAGDAVYIEHVNEMKAALDNVRWISRANQAATRVYHGGWGAEATWAAAWTAAKVDIGYASAGLGTRGEGWKDGATFYGAVDRTYITWPYDKTFAIGGTITSYDIEDWRIAVPEMVTQGTWGGTGYWGATSSTAEFQTDIAQRLSVLMVQPAVADLDLSSNVVYWGDWTDPDTDYQPTAPTGPAHTYKGHAIYSSRLIAGQGLTVFLKMIFSYAA